MLRHKIQGAGGVGGEAAESWDFNTSNTTVTGAPFPELVSEFYLNSLSGITTLGRNTFKFADSGTKLFVVDDGGNKLIHYTLSTAYDMSTASSASDTYSYSTNTRAFGGHYMSADGTKFWFMDDTTQECDYYTCTAFDISTASYQTTSTVIQAQDTDCESMAMNSDGTILLAIGRASNVLMEFSLSTAYDLSTLSFVDEASISFNADYFTIDSGGTKIITCDFTSTSVESYTLSTAWDASTVSAATSYGTDDLGVDTVGYTWDLQGWDWNGDGTKAYVQMYHGTSNKWFARIEMSSAYSLNTASFTKPSELINASISPGSTVNDIAWGDSGSKMFVIHNDGTTFKVGSITCSTPYDITTAGTVTYSSNLVKSTNVWSFCFNNDGTKMFVSQQSDITYEYDLSTAWDVSTISYSGNSLTHATHTIRVFQMNSAGTELYYNDNGDGIGVIDLTTANTCAGGYTVNAPYTGLTHTGLMMSPQFSPDGLRFSALEDASGVSNHNAWVLTTAFDISTGGSKNSNAITGAIEMTTYAAINPAGTKMAVFSKELKHFYEVTLSP